MLFCSQEFLLFFGAVFVAYWLLGSPACQAFRAVLERARRDRIQRAMVLMPEGGEFRSWNAKTVWEQISDFLEGLSRQYDAPPYDPAQPFNSHLFEYGLE